MKLRILLLVIAAAAIALQLTGSLCADVSWINLGVERMLRGGVLYRDIVEVNPPVIYLVSIPPVALAMALGFAVQLSFVPYVAAISLTMVWLSYHLPAQDVRDTRAFQFLCVGQAASLLLVGENFGQREQFIFMFAVPYVLLTGLRCKAVPISERLAVFCGRGSRRCCSSQAALRAARNCS